VPGSFKLKDSATLVEQRNERIRSLENEVSDLKHGKSLPWPAISDTLHVGSIGLPQKIYVTQVLGPTEYLGQTGSPPQTIVVRGFATKRLARDVVTQIHAPVEVTGTTTYEPVPNTSSTALVVEPFDPARLQSYLPDVNLVFVERWVPTHYGLSADRLQYLLRTGSIVED
jgi:hypothetical protein